MRLLIQRVSSASVTVDHKQISAIGPGFLVFFAVEKIDNEEPISFLADKLLNLRIFEDDQGKMNRSIFDTNGEILIVSQFTLYADCSKGRRPTFIHSAPATVAEPLYDSFVQTVKEKYPRVQTGQFQALMQVALVNDGPLTFLLERSPANSALPH